MKNVQIHQMKDQKFSFSLELASANLACYLVVAVEW